MERYTYYLENKFDVWQMIIAILCAVAMIVVIIVGMSLPIDSAELESHYAQLGTIKQDASNIYKLHNADISIDDKGMTVTLKGNNHNIKAYFDENKNYLNAVVEDNRLGANIMACVIIVILTWGVGYAISYVVLLVLYIPVLVYAFIIYLKRKKNARKKYK